jgi:beta-lactamase class A
LVANGRPVAEVAVRGGRARFTLDGPAGRYDLRVVFTNGRTLGARTAAGVRLLPASARAARPGTRIDADRQAALSRALSRGPAHRAAWVQDLTDGTVASANAGARFPAASVVKLGLLAGVLARVPGDAGRSPIGQDLRAVAHWSSNLAANRLVRRYGLGIASTGLRRLGARESTYTGEYIVGTELQPGLPAGGIGSTPPVVSGRVTTTRDLARMLYSIHASAVGVRAANRRTGLSVTDARQALGWLLASEQRGDNASLLAGGAGGAPIAQKNGWLRAARHAAGIVYAEGGPRIVVVMTYDAAGVSLPDARVLGARVAGVAG